MPELSSREMAGAMAADAPPALPRVLFLAHRPLAENDFGGGQRTAHIWAAVATMSEVDTLVIQSGPEGLPPSGWDDRRTATVEMPEPGVAPRAVAGRRRVRRWVRAIVADGSYDLVVARYPGLASLLPRTILGRTVLDGDDLVKTPVGTASGTARLSVRLKSVARRVLVRRLLGDVGHVWFVNPRDQVALGDACAHGHSLLPNAAVRHAAPSPPPPRDPDRIVVVGHHAHEPNREAVDYLIEHVLPGLRAARPELVLRVVGAVPEDEAERWSSSPGVQVCGFVPDLGDEYARAGLAVVPVHSGGGTQIKLIEALLHGCPVVASEFAYRGFAQTLVEGEHLRVARSPQEWVDLCLAVLRDPAGAAAQAAAASEVIARSYGVPALQEHVRRTLRELLAQSGRRPVGTAPGATADQPGGQAGSPR